MYGVIRRWRADAATLQDFVQRIQGVLPELQAIQGFVSYSVVMEGAAVIVTLGDRRAPPGKMRRFNQHLVKDADVVTMLNALWAAGARAVVVGGQRVAATTQIRATGPVLLVDGVPVRTSPMTIVAFGDPVRLAAALEQPGGLRDRYKAAGSPILAVQKVNRLKLSAYQRVSRHLYRQQ